MIKIFKILSLLLLVAFISGCNGGSDSSDNTTSTTENTLKGVFIDSPVAGLRWVSNNEEGLTDAQGTFRYAAGNIVQFYIGDLFIGEAVGEAIITPLELVSGAKSITDDTVTNIIRFLMTLDDDGNPDNGIVITPEVASAASGNRVKFNQAIADFTSSGTIQQLIADLTAVTSAGVRILVPAVEAHQHIESSIKGILAGVYGGVYSGSFSGIWTGTLSPAGLFSGTVTSSEGDVFSFSGLVSGNGSGESELTTSGNVSDGASFLGVFQTDGTVSGRWNSTDGGSGIWSGTKISPMTETGSTTPWHQVGFQANYRAYFEGDPSISWKIRAKFTGSSLDAAGKTIIHFEIYNEVNDGQTTAQQLEADFLDFSDDVIGKVFYELSDSGNAVERCVIKGLKEVTVPAGTFQAYKRTCHGADHIVGLALEDHVFPEHQRWSLWFHPEFLLVKQKDYSIDEQSKAPLTWELISVNTKE